MRPVCIGCKKHPDQIPEYLAIAAEEGMTPDSFVRSEEGTYNPENGHFMCTDCYCNAGCPRLPGRTGWRAP